MKRNLLKFLIALSIIFKVCFRASVNSLGLDDDTFVNQCLYELDLEEIDDSNLSDENVLCFKKCLLKKQRVLDDYGTINFQSPSLLRMFDSLTEGQYQQAVDCLKASLKSNIISSCTEVGTILKCIDDQNQSLVNFLLTEARNSLLEAITSYLTKVANLEYSTEGDLAGMHFRASALLSATRTK